MQKKEPQTQNQKKQKTPKLSLRLLRLLKLSLRLSDALHSDFKNRKKKWEVASQILAYAEIEKA